jgi:hypothetical protein
LNNQKTKTWTLQQLILQLRSEADDLEKIVSLIESFKSSNLKHRKVSITHYPEYIKQIEAFCSVREIDISTEGLIKRESK